MLDGLLPGSALSHESIRTALGLDPIVKMVEARVTDAVTGGCLLSAAELDSSKNYIQVMDQWQIAYTVRVVVFILSFWRITQMHFNGIFWHCMSTATYS